MSHLPTWRRLDRLPACSEGQVPVERTLGPEGINDLIAQYQAGTSTRELARRFDIAKTSVINVLRRRGVAIRPRGYAERRGTTTHEHEAAPRQ